MIVDNLVVHITRKSVRDREDEATNNNLAVTEIQ